MGYVYMTSPCGACGRLFSYNPHYVPSKNDVPFCESCITVANPMRLKNGLSPIVPHPQAYEPLREEEL